MSASTTQGTPQIVNNLCRVKPPSVHHIYAILQFQDLVLEQFDPDNVLKGIFVIITEPLNALLSILL